MADPVAVGIDAGGTKLVAASITGDGDVVEQRRRVTPQGDPDALVSILVELARELGGGDLPVGVGIAGIVSREGELRYGPNVSVSDLPLSRDLTDALGVEVAVANDATVALFGEVTAGAGNGVEDALMLTLGTGVGGAAMIRGHLLEGAHGFAGEFGHVVVAEGGRGCPCGNRGCLEAYASGRAVGRHAAELLKTGDAGAADSSLAALEGEVDGRAVTEAAEGGDAFAQRMWTEAGFWLGVGMTSLVNALDPALVLVGGGAAPRNAEWVLPEAERVLGERIMGRTLRDPPPVVLAALGDDAGMIGAGLLARDLAR